MNHPLTSNCDIFFFKKEKKKKKTKIKHWPFTFSKILTFAEPTMTKKCTSHCSRRNWLKGKVQKNKTRSKPSVWLDHVRNARGLFIWDDGYRKWRHSAEATDEVNFITQSTDGVTSSLSQSVKSVNQSVTDFHVYRAGPLWSSQKRQIKVVTC